MYGDRIDRRAPRQNRIQNNIRTNNDISDDETLSSDEGFVGWDHNTRERLIGQRDSATTRATRASIPQATRTNSGSGSRITSQAQTALRRQSNTSMTVQKRNSNQSISSSNASAIAKRSGVAFRDRNSMIVSSPTPLSDSFIKKVAIEDGDSSFDNSSYDSDDDDFSSDSDDSDTGSDGSESSGSLSYDENKSDSEEEGGWSVRIRLIEVENLPSHLTPTMPFCPVIKFGLVSTTKQNIVPDKIKNTYFQGDAARRPSTLPIAKKVEYYGLANLVNSKARCSSGLVLSVQDKTKFEWFEELRWDNVRKPLQTAVALELCGRKIPPIELNIAQEEEIRKNQSSPTNSRNLQQKGTYNMYDHSHKDLLKNKTRNQPNSTTQAFMKFKQSLQTNEGGGGLGGIAKLWRNKFGGNNSANNSMHGKSGGIDPSSQNNTQLQTATAAAAVAQFLTKDSSDNQNNSHSGTSGNLDLENNWRSNLSSQTSGPNNIQENICLGSLIIPLSRLPLEDATGGKNQYAVTDQWYPINVSTLNSPSNPSLPASSSKSPSVRLEISFATSIVLDESEDDFDDDDEDDELGTLHENDSYATGKSDLEGPSTHDMKFIDTVFGSQTASISVHESMASSVRRRRSSIVRRGSISQSTHGGKMSRSIRRRSSVKPNPIKTFPEEPFVEPGVVDFISVVGARDIGANRDDDGTSGWVKSDPECCVLEQFPKDDEFHRNNGRMACLPNKVEWFCFPDGCKLWRGTEPPTKRDLANMKPTINSQQHSNVHSSMIISNPAFDACLNCTTVFSWFVISSTSESYGSKNVKTYGAVIRFFAPAPCGIDPTQDDFAQPGTATTSQISSNNYHYEESNHHSPSPLRSSYGEVKRKRLWVPIGICATSTLPIVGAMEAILLRICQSISPNKNLSSSLIGSVLHEDIANLIINYQAPIPGVLHSSIPFLSSERLHLTLPPITGLPPLPHGTSCTLVCKLLGAEGVTILLAAVLAECKILLHSNCVSHLPMVAEVITALMYPFEWKLPYIPLLPEQMLEFVEAPLSYFVGIPSSALKYINDDVLTDVVVVNLNVPFSVANYGLESKGGKKYRLPTPLPTNIIANIQKEVFTLLKEEEDVEKQYGDATARNFSPRLESESLAEREFRITVALQVSSLVRGYHDCLYFENDLPMFNREQFLKTAVAMFEPDSKDSYERKLCFKNKRFLITLLNTQNFFGLVESIHSEDNFLFHEIMDIFDVDDEKYGSIGSTLSRPDVCRKAIEQLRDTLQDVEDAIPTYRVDFKEKKLQNRDWDSKYEEDSLLFESNQILRYQKTQRKECFTYSLLKSVVPPKDESFQSENGTTEKTEKNLSLTYLVELEKNLWQYCSLFDISSGGIQYKVRPKVTIRKAIGEELYHQYLESKQTDGDNTVKSSSSISTREDTMTRAGSNLDLRGLLSSVNDNMKNSSVSSKYTPEVNTAKDARDRDVLKRCLERAYGEAKNRANFNNMSSSISFEENGRDLIKEAEFALRNPSAQRFLLAVLGQRSRLENIRRRRKKLTTRNANSETSSSRLLPDAFRCLVRLCNAMLQACLDQQNYEGAYHLLTQSAGFCTAISSTSGSESIIQLSTNVGKHPIFADLSLWERVLNLHQQEIQNSEEYEGVVFTLQEMHEYGVPAEELLRFAARVSDAKGWFSTKKGEALLVEAREMSMKSTSDNNRAASFTGLYQNPSSLQMMSSSLQKQNLDSVETNIGENNRSLTAIEWEEIAWYHPTSEQKQVPVNRAQKQNSSLRRSNTQERLLALKRFTNPEGGPYTRSSSGSLGNSERSIRQDITTPVINANGYKGKSAITCMASFGSSVIATGALDGSVFLAHTIKFNDGLNFKREVKGSRLTWGINAGNNGPVKCIAGTKSTGYRHKTPIKSLNNHGEDPAELDVDDEILSSVQGCRIIAGSANGPINVWSVKDVYQSSVIAMKNDVDPESMGLLSQDSRNYHGNGVSGPSSTTISSKQKFMAASRGRTLIGHTGGVNCIDVPSTMYRPDSLVSGGEDGLIKLWSLRHSGSTNPVAGAPSVNARFFAPRFALQQDANKQKLLGDPQCVMSGHEGKILCIKTAWHGDRLLSGGADGLVRLWDLAVGEGKCLQELFGHILWVTHVQYWGANTIVSASTDRAVALWDARIGNSPLFMLRYHGAYVSDILLGSRTEHIFASAGGDGTIATWDIRSLTSSRDMLKPGSYYRTDPLRQPLTVMEHSDTRFGHCSGGILLARGAAMYNPSMYSTSIDGIVREWDIATGRRLGSKFSGHSDAISCFASFHETENLSKTQSQRRANISCSFDGTVRLRRQVKENVDT